LDKQQRRRTEPDADEVDCVWEAIALHSSLGIAHRRGLLTYLTHRGVFIDAGRDTGLPADLIQRVRAAYPHQAGKRYLADAIAGHASRSEAAPGGWLQAHGSQVFLQNIWMVSAAVGGVRALASALAAKDVGAAAVPRGGVYTLRTADEALNVVRTGRTGDLAVRRAALAKWVTP
jgi:hypothetical protein